MDLLQLTPAQLRQAASLKERIAELEGELESILGTSATATPSRKLHWTQTPAGRARLARSVRRSWRTRRRSYLPNLLPQRLEVRGLQLHQLYLFPVIQVDCLLQPVPRFLQIPKLTRITGQIVAHDVFLRKLVHD